MSDSSDLKNTEAELRKQFEALKSQLGIPVPESPEPAEEEAKPAEPQKEESVTEEKKEEEPPKEEPKEVEPPKEEPKEEEPPKEEPKEEEPPKEEPKEEKPKEEEPKEEKKEEEHKEDVKPVEAAVPVEEPAAIPATAEEKKTEAKEEKATADDSNQPSKEQEQEDMFSKVVKSFVNESFIIDDYDHYDSKKPLMQIVRTRIDGTREYSPPLIGGDECDAMMVRSNAVKAEEEDGISTLIPREMHASKPPKNWQPVVDDFHIFDLPKSKPEDQGGVCYECKQPFHNGKVRLCTYTGKYFCNKCFPPGKKFYVPSKVIQHWDFELYPINPRSYDYLCSVMANPMVDISLAHPQLYTRVPVMKDLNMIRRKLYFMKDFILSCSRLKDDDPAKKSLVSCRPYYYTHVDIFAFDDLIHSERLLEALMDVLEAWLTHIASCQLCGAKGSYCEICGKNERIFPFQLLEVIQCPDCKGVFHRACLKKNKCPKCQRVNKRH